MSRHARIEEVSDSESDPSDMDPEEFDPAQIMAPVASSAASSSLTRSSSMPSTAPPGSQFQATRDASSYKHYQSLYPVYFDSNRSRTEGRRVGKELAVENPLAMELVSAVKMLGLDCVFEPGKCHPKDWANPGRVKVRVKEKGRPLSPRVKNKHHLYTLVSVHLKAHPTTEASPALLHIPQMPRPDPEKPNPPPAVPKGWKMNTILPLHSPAISGGGVSENFLQEMMAEMQGGQGQGMPQLENGGGAPAKKKKKDKVKNKFEMGSFISH